MDRREIFHKLRDCLQVIVLATIPLDDKAPVTATRIQAQVERMHDWFKILEDETRL